MRRLRKHAALLGLSAAVGIIACGGAAAAAERVAALLPQTHPVAATEVRDQFHEAVTRGLQGAGDDVIAAAEVRLRLGAVTEMLECDGAVACVGSVVQALHVGQVVASDIEISGKDYAIKLRLLDPSGRELAKVEEPCDICTLKEADEAVARAATKLATAARALPAPAPVEIKPVEPVPPPKPEAIVKPEQPPPHVEEAPPQPTPAPLSDPLAQQQQPEKKGFPWRPVAIASLAAGVVGLAVGIPLLAIDGNPTCNKPDARTSCPNVYNTVGGGATLLTLGLAGVAASGVLFYFDHRARNKARPNVVVMPTVGGAFVSTGGHF
jgi:hypothetical protein